MLRSKRVWDEAFLIVTSQIMSPYELWEMNTDVCKWVNYLKSPFGRTSCEHERPTSPTSLWRATRFSLSTNATMLGALGRLVVCTSTSSLFRLSFEFVWCIVHVLVPLCFCPYVPQPAAPCLTLPTNRVLVPVQLTAFCHRFPFHTELWISCLGFLFRL